MVVSEASLGDTDASSKEGGRAGRGRGGQEPDAAALQGGHHFLEKRGLSLVKRNWAERGTGALWSFLLFCYVCNTLQPEQNKLILWLFNNKATAIR